MTSTKKSSIFKGASVGFGVSILKVGFLLEQTDTRTWMQGVYWEGDPGNTCWGGET